MSLCVRPRSEILKSPASIVCCLSEPVYVSVGGQAGGHVCEVNIDYNVKETNSTKRNGAMTAPEL